MGHSGLCGTGPSFSLPGPETCAHGKMGTKDQTHLSCNPIDAWCPASYPHSVAYLLYLGARWVLGSVLRSRDFFFNRGFIVICRAWEGSRCALQYSSGFLGVVRAPVQATLVINRLPAEGGCNQV